MLPGCDALPKPVPAAPFGPGCVAPERRQRGPGGGRINRLKPAYGFPPSYSHQVLGTLNDLAFTHQCAETTAQTLQSARINLTLAPVVDLNVNPDNPIIGYYERSFSAGPDIVTARISTPTIPPPYRSPPSPASCAISSAGTAS